MRFGVLSALCVSLALVVSVGARAQQQAGEQGDAAKAAPQPAVAVAPVDAPADHTADLYQAQSGGGKGGSAGYDSNQPLPGALNAPTDLPSALQTTDR